MIILCEFARTVIPPYFPRKLVPSQFTPAARVSEFLEHLSSISICGYHFSAGMCMQR